MAFVNYPSGTLPDGFDSDLFRKSTLDGFFGLGSETVQDGVSIIFHRADMGQRTVKEMAMAGLTPFREWPAEGDISYGQLEKMWESTIGYRDFSNGILFNRQTARDIEWGIVQKSVSEFGYMASVTEQQIAVDWLEGSSTVTTTAGSAPQAMAAQTLLDNQPIFGNHPLSARVGGNYGTPTSGAYHCNLVSGQINVANLRALLRAVRNTPTHLNVPGNFEPDTLLCHPDKEDQIAELLFSAMRADTANNADNMFKRNWNVTLKTWRFLSDTNAVYAIDSQKHGLYLYTRQGVTTGRMVDFDSEQIRFKASFAKGAGAVTWRGVAKLSGS